MELNYDKYYYVEEEAVEELARQLHKAGIKYQILQLKDDRFVAGVSTDEATFTYLLDKATDTIAEMKKLREKATVDVDGLFEKCKKELREIQIPIAKDEQMELEIRRISENGVQAYCASTENYHRIVVKSCHTTGKHPDLHQLCCIIMHELVHTCPGCDDHGKLFMKYGEIINEKLGYNILQDESLLSYRHADEPIQLIGKCPTCLSTVIYRTQKDMDTNLIAMKDSTYKGFKVCPYCKCEFQYKKVTY